MTKQHGLYALIALTGIASGVGIDRGYLKAPSRTAAHQSDPLEVDTINLVYPDVNANNDAKVEFKRIKVYRTWDLAELQHSSEPEDPKTTWILNMRMKDGRDIAVRAKRITY